MILDIHCKDANSTIPAACSLSPRYPADIWRIMSHWLVLHAQCNRVNGILGCLGNMPKAGIAAKYAYEAANSKCWQVMQLDSI